MWKCAPPGNRVGTEYIMYQSYCAHTSERPPPTKNRDPPEIGKNGIQYSGNLDTFEKINVHIFHMLGASTGALQGTYLVPYMFLHTVCCILAGSWPGLAWLGGSVSVGVVRREGACLIG